MKVVFLLMIILFSSCITTTISHYQGKTIVEKNGEIFILSEDFSGKISESGELIQVGEK